MDATVSATGLIVLTPLLAVIALAVRVDSAGPVLFRHERVGHGGRKFRLLKFRSMTDRACGPDVTVAGDPRVTRVGGVLRKTKLDELPQLWNVLVGDMSLVGPRPEVERHVRAFQRDYDDILTVRPGITDFAAIEYRHEEQILADTTDPETAYRTVVLPAKITLYRKYLAEQSLTTDMKLILRTVLAIARRDGAPTPGSESRP